MQQESPDKNSNPKIYTDADFAKLARLTKTDESPSEESRLKLYIQLRDELLSKPAIMVGYIEGTLRAQHKSASTVGLQTSVLKQLFNHAGKPIPKEVEQSTAVIVRLPRKELASLVTATAKKAGYGVVYRAKLYLKTRFPKTIFS